MERDAALPRPIELDIPTTGKHVTLNLMPFSIDYNGSAPVDKYFVTRPLSDNERESSFRGRRVHGTRLELSGYCVGLYRVHESDIREPAPKRLRQSLPSKPGPVRAKRFALDDDDVGTGPETEVTSGHGHKAEDHAAVHSIYEMRADAVAGDTIWIWGPDGPVDKGNDAYIRVSTEWLSTIVPQLHSC